MIGFLIALLSGALMSIQGVFNTQVTKTTGMWVGNGWVQFTAFAVCLAMWFFTGRDQVSQLMEVQPKYMLLGGVIGAGITWTVIKSIEAILILLAEPKMGIYFIIFIIALQQFDGNVLGPKILGDSTGLSAFWVVFSILIGGGLFGVPGMILGVPTFAVVYYIVGMLVNNKLEKKKLPVKTDAYDEYSYVESDGTYVHADKNIFKEKER